MNDVNSLHPDNPSRNAIVFLHAFATDHRLWDAQMRALPMGWHGVAYDLFGFGAAPAPDTAGDYGVDALVGQLLAVMERDGIERAVLCGLSFGGHVALSAAAAEPRRIAGLILAGTGSGSTDREAFLAALATWIERLGRGGVEGLAEFLLGHPLFADYAGRGDAEREALRRMMLATTESGYRHSIEQVMMKRRPVQDLLPAVASSGIPTHVVVGERDLGCLAPSRMIAEQIPGAALTVLADCGHFSNLEKPAAFNAIMQTFLERTHAGPA